MADRSHVAIYRVATYNVSLTRAAAGELANALAAPGDRRAEAVARIIRAHDPDILLLNEFDHDPDGRAVRGFLEHYLTRPMRDRPASRLRHWYAGPVNTGQPSGFDLDRDGRTDEPEDSWGFGRFPGQYGMVALSAHPIDTARIRDFGALRWAAMPDARVPINPKTGKAWYSAEMLAAMPLSSKSHWDISIDLPSGRTLHILASHPTPPVFDGPEDRNGRRNADEIRFWRDYLTPGADGYLRDRAGRAGGLAADAAFAILGDLNLDPNDGAGFNADIQDLLDHPRIQDPKPRSRGAAHARQSGANASHRGDPALDTANFPEWGRAPGNLRVDYVLPDQGLEVLDSGVAWPERQAARRGFPSDHHLVWVDLAF